MSKAQPKKRFHQGSRSAKVGDEDRLQQAGIQDLLDVAEIPIGAEYGHGAGIAGDVVQIVSGVDGGYGHGHAADPLDGQPGQDPLNGIGQVQNDLIAFFYAHSVQRAGQLLNVGQDAGIGIARAQVDDRRLAGRLARLLLKSPANM